jgi:hypothetical protein
VSSTSDVIERKRGRCLQCLAAGAEPVKLVETSGGEVLVRLLLSLDCGRRLVDPGLGWHTWGFGAAAEPLGVGGAVSPVRAGKRMGRPPQRTHRALARAARKARPDYSLATFIGEDEQNDLACRSTWPRRCWVHQRRIQTLVGNRAGSPDPNTGTERNRRGHTLGHGRM